MRVAFFIPFTGPSDIMTSNSTWLNLQMKNTKVGSVLRRYGFMHKLDSNRKIEHAKTGRHAHTVQPVSPPLASLGLLCCAMSCRAVCCDAWLSGANGSTCVVC